MSCYQLIWRGLFDQLVGKRRRVHARSLLLSVLQFEDLGLPTEVRDLRKRHGVSLLGSAANVHHCVPVRLGQPAELPTQTTERLDHVSCAKAWMLVSIGDAHALAYDFGLVPPAVMAPLQRRLEGEF